MKNLVFRAPGRFFAGQVVNLRPIGNRPAGIARKSQQGASTARGAFSTLFEWAFGPRNPMKNRVFVGRPILAAAVFQAAFSRLRASLAEGNRRWFFAPVASRRARRRGGGVSPSMNDT
jgi:hypothetical protein